MHPLPGQSLMQAFSRYSSMHAQPSCCHCRQREFLERTISTLRRKVTVEGDQHRADYVRIRQVGCQDRILPLKLPIFHTSVPAAGCCDSSVGCKLAGCMCSRGLIYDEEGGLLACSQKVVLLFTRSVNNRLAVEGVISACQLVFWSFQ